MMADGSRLPATENMKLVSEAVALAARYGGDVEAELGHVAGEEDSATASSPDSLIDPEEAVILVARSAPACLAISIGNVHGIYRRRPRLDWLSMPSAHGVTIPLSLHGASGLDLDDLRRAVAAGIRKVNINTELRERYLETLSEHLAQARAGANVLALREALVEAIAAITREKIQALQRPSSTHAQP